jgi:hypothetical protein
MHFPIEASILKKACIFKRSNQNAATLQGVLCFVTKRVLSQKKSKMNVISN